MSLVTNISSFYIDNLFVNDNLLEVHFTYFNLTPNLKFEEGD